MIYNMSPAELAGFFEGLGNRIIQTDSAYWYGVNKYGYNSIPFTEPINLEQDEPSQLWKQGAMVVRYPTINQGGSPSYLWICDNKNYNLESFNSNMRRKFKRCEVKQIDFLELADLGLDIYLSTLSRQGREIPKNLQEYWTKLCKVGGKTNGSYAWGAYVEDKLTAYVVSFTCNRTLILSIIRSDQQMLNFYPNNALIFHITKWAMEHDNIDRVCYGLASLQGDNLESLNKFKQQMGYQMVQINQKALFHPIIKPINAMIKPVISWSADRYQNSAKLQQLNSLLKFAN